MEHDKGNTQKNYDYPLPATGSVSIPGGQTPTFHPLTGKEAKLVKDAAKEATQKKTA